MWLAQHTNVLIVMDTVLCLLCCQLSNSHSLYNCFYDTAAVQQVHCLLVSLQTSSLLIFLQKRIVVLTVIQQAPNFRSEKDLCIQIPSVSNTAIMHIMCIIQLLNIDDRCMVTDKRMLIIPCLIVRQLTNKLGLYDMFIKSQIDAQLLQGMELNVSRPEVRLLLSKSMCNEHVDI